jgi:hypothetical protein
MQQNLEVMYLKKAEENDQLKRKIQELEQTIVVLANDNKCFKTQPELVTNETSITSQALVMQSLPTLKQLTGKRNSLNEPRPSILNSLKPLNKLSRDGSLLLVDKNLQVYMARFDTLSKKWLHKANSNYLCANYSYENNSGCTRYRRRGDGKNLCIRCAKLDVYKPT